MIPLRTRRILVLVSLFCAVGAGPIQVAAGPLPDLTRPSDFSLYIAPNGNDARSGASAAEAVRTLSRVQELLKSRQFKNTERKVSVKFLPGTYVGLTVTWDFYAQGRTIVFEPDAFRAGSFPVVADGQNGNAEFFFLLRVVNPAPDNEPVETGIVVRGIHITNYCEGISLGDWKSKANVTGNLIENNKFTRIGSRYQTPTTQPDGRKLPTGSCVAAIRLQRASGNTIRYNEFRDIENLPVRQTGAKKYGPLLLHAIYLSQHSSDNLIEGNRFARFSGSPVRIRAESDGNRVVDNTFEAPLYPAKVPEGYRINAVSQWYCNVATEACRAKAAEGKSECPSTGTEIVGNRVEGGIDLYADESQSKIPTCPPSQRARGSIEPKLERNTVQP